MKKSGVILFLILFVALVNTRIGHSQEPDTAVVQAILFYSPTCPHCHDVIENHLPSIKEQFGGQLQLVGIDTSNQAGSQLYQDAVDAFSIPQDRLGVPTMIVGDIILVGSSEIPEQLPAIIEDGLAHGGIGWPDIPGLKEKVPNLPPKAGEQVESLSSDSTAGTGTELMEEGLPGDFEKAPEVNPGFALGWVVMVFMLLALTYGAVRLAQTPATMFADPPVAERISSWLIPFLAVTGLGIALYLAYVEITEVAAVCGPVGECNIVQASPYARILNIPVAVLGALYYLAIIGFWFLPRIFRTQTLKWAPLMLLILSFIGVLFSIYLTALELFIIHAICVWCISSAVISTIIMLIIVVAFTKPKSAGQTPDVVSNTA